MSDVLMKLPYALLALVLAGGPAAAAEVREHVLDNGLKVLVKVDRRAPVVVSQLWYRVGSSYEHGGVTGLSHMLEHMMFKGTERLGPGEFARTIAEHGGRQNAFTGQDYTAYYESLARQHLGLALELEAERMHGLALAEPAFESERRVVMEERRLRTEDRPERFAREQLMAAAFQASGYQHPVIGWMDDIAHYRIEDLRAWYRRWYAPNNAVLVVVGDIDAQAVLRLAGTHFGGLARAELTPPKPRQEPPQPGERRVTVRREAKVPYLAAGYKAPTLATAEAPWEAYALHVAAALLGGDESARLHGRLVRGQGLAARARAAYDLYDRATTLLTLSLTPAPGTDLDALERAARAQVAALREAPVGDAELARVKTRLVAERVYARDSLFHQAYELGRLEAVGLGWERAGEQAHAIRAVTAAQVQAVAAKYLVDDRLTVVRLVPAGEAEHGRAP